MVLAGALLAADPASHRFPALLDATITCADAGYQHHATLVVSHLRTAPTPVRVCVGFDEEHITGHQLLDRSHLEWGGSGYYGGQGSAVCQVDNEPTTYSPDCLQSSTPYWSLWIAPPGQPWSSSRVGIDGVTIRDGDSEGFRYADGNGQRPPDSPGEACPPPPPPPPSPSPTSRVADTGPPGTAPTTRAGAPLTVGGTPAAAADPPSPPAAEPSAPELLAPAVPTPSEPAAPPLETAKAPPHSSSTSRPPTNPLGWILALTVFTALAGLLLAQLMARR